MPVRLRRITLVVAPVLFAVATGARGQPANRLTPEQREVAAIVDVLREARVDPPDACIAALDEMHATENQLQTLTGQITQDNETEPVQRQTAGEIGIGRDVLGSDLDETVSSCRSTADRACSDPPSGPTTAASCNRLRQAELTPPLRRP